MTPLRALASMPDPLDAEVLRVLADRLRGLTHGANITVTNSAADAMLALLDEIDRLDAENAAMRPVVEAALRVRAATDGRSALDAGDALADITDRFAALRSVRRGER